MIGEIVEFGWFEANVFDRVLCDVLSSDLKLFWIRFFLAHPMHETSLSICTHSRNEQKISLSSSKDPIPISANLN